MSTAVSESGWLSYAELVAEHGVTPALAMADGVHAALIHHLFSGACVTGEGPGCRKLVHGEKWVQLFGIMMIDLTCFWVDGGKVSDVNLSFICLALGLVSKATTRKRLHLTNLTNLCQSLVCALDVAVLCVPEVIEKIWSPSTLESVCAACNAHNLPALPSDAKEDLGDQVIEHIAHGECSGKHAPGCDHVIQELSHR